jgi:hypothetical protein
VIGLIREGKIVSWKRGRERERERESEKERKKENTD